MTNYNAAVTQYVINDDVAEDREWLGTITTSDSLTFQFRQNDYGIYSSDDADWHGRLRLYTPANKLIAWSDSKDADEIRAAVQKAIREAAVIYRPVYIHEGEIVNGVMILLHPDSVIYVDSFNHVVYSRRSDGFVDMESRQPFSETEAGGG